MVHRKQVISITTYRWNSETGPAFRKCRSTNILVFDGCANGPLIVAAYEQSLWFSYSGEIQAYANITLWCGPIAKVNGTNIRLFTNSQRISDPCRLGDFGSQRTRDGLDIMLSRSIMHRHLTAFVAIVFIAKSSIYGRLYGISSPKEDTQFTILCVNGVIHLKCCRWTGMACLFSPICHIKTDLSKCLFFDHNIVVLLCLYHRFKHLI